MKAVVMAGGEGTRLRPLTSNRPKPLMPVVNKPIMEHIIDLLRLHGLTDIVVTLHYLADEIESYFGDGSEFGVRIHYSVEDTPLGTAGSVRNAKRWLGDEPILIISGDALTDINLSSVITWHKMHDSKATIILKSVSNPLEYGVVITEADGSISRFMEKPSPGEVFSDTVNTGMYLLEPSVTAMIPDSGPVDFSQDIFPMLLKNNQPPYGYVAEGYWCDIGNLEQYRQAHHDVFKGAVKVQIPGEQTGNVWIGKGSEIHPSVEIAGPAVIGRNCRIKSGSRFLDFAVIGDNSLIEHDAVLRRSILWENNYVGAKTRLYDSVIGAGCILKDDINVGEGAVLGEHCRVEQGSTLRPNIKVWPEKVIESGSTVTMSLVWGNKWRGSLFRELGVSGVSNVEMTPDYVTKLGFAYGAFLKKGSLVLASDDSHNVSKMLKRSMISALVSVGVDVLDLQSLPLPIARHSIRSSGASGGIHVRIAPDNSQLSLIEIFDEKGINLSKAAERKVENIFFREDFRRTDPEQVGDIDYASKAIEQYRQSFFRCLDLSVLEKADYNIVLDYGFGRLSSVFPGILGRLGLDLIALNAYSDPRRSSCSDEDRQSLLSNLSSIVLTLKANAGILLDSEGERVIVIDERGRVLSGNQLLAVLIRLTLDTNPGTTIAIPVTVPTIIDQIIRDSGGETLWTKADVRALLAASQESKVILAGDERGGIIYSRFQPAFDAMFTTARLLELTARQKVSLSELVDRLPPFGVTDQLVYCPWEQKGKVMRLLREENRSSADLIDGVRVFMNGSSAVILPHASEPYIRIYAEADSDSAAHSTVKTLAAKIEHLRE